MALPVLVYFFQLYFCHVSYSLCAFHTRARRASYRAFPAKTTGYRQFVGKTYSRFVLEYRRRHYCMIYGKTANGNEGRGKELYRKRNLIFRRLSRYCYVFARRRHYLISQAARRTPPRHVPFDARRGTVSPSPNPVNNNLLRRRRQYSLWGPDYTPTHVIVAFLYLAEYPCSIRNRSSFVNFQFFPLPSPH